MEKIKFQVPDSVETAEFYILEQTKINGICYLLVTTEEDGDCDAFIMREIKADQGDSVTYEMVESDEELEYMSKLFASLLEDVDIGM